MTTLPADNTFNDPAQRAPLVLNHADFGSVTETICSVHEARRAPRAWYIAFAISLAFMSILGIMILYLFVTGVGVWGIHGLSVAGRPLPLA